MTAQAWQQTIRGIPAGRTHAPQHRRLRPTDMRVGSAAEARRRIRALRRVYPAGRWRFEVLSTRGDYRHVIELIRRGDDWDLRCIAEECLAPHGACWAATRVASSKALRRTLREEMAR